MCNLLDKKQFFLRNNLSELNGQREANITQTNDTYLFHAIVFRYDGFCENELTIKTA